MLHSTCLIWQIRVLIHVRIYIYTYIFDVTEKYIYVYVYISIGLGICNNSVLPAHVCPRGLRTVLLAALCWFLEGYNRTWNGNVNPIHVLLMPVPDNDPISSRCRTAVIPSAAPTRFPLHSNFTHFNFPTPVRRAFLDKKENIRRFDIPSKGATRW